MATGYGAKVGQYALSELTYGGCRNLFRCKQDLDHCGQHDDLTPVLEAVTQAQVLVLASPVYFTNVTGQLKLAIDRFFSFLVPDYSVVEQKSRLGTERSLVFVLTQGGPEELNSTIPDSFALGFRFLGYDRHYKIRACNVREPGDVLDPPVFLNRCETVAREIYTR